MILQAFNEHHICWGKPNWKTGDKEKKSVQNISLKHNLDFMHTPQDMIFFFVSGGNGEKPPASRTWFV